MKTRCNCMAILVVIGTLIALFALYLLGRKWEMVLGVACFGFLFGFFLTYSIRSGSRTQDAFKSFVGVLGSVGAGSGLAWLRQEQWVVPAYGYGLFAGFVAYAAASVCLASIYGSAKAAEGATPAAGDARKAEAIAAAIIGRSLLGEEFDPPRPPQPAAWSTKGGSPPVETSGGGRAPEQHQEETSR